MVNLFDQMTARNIQGFNCEGKMPHLPWLWKSYLVRSLIQMCHLLSSPEGLGIGLEFLGIFMELFVPAVRVCLSYRSPTLIPWRCYWQLGALKGENPVPVLHPVVQQVVSSL